MLASRPYDGLKAFAVFHFQNRRVIDVRDLDVTGLGLAEQHVCALVSIARHQHKPSVSEAVIGLLGGSLCIQLAQ
ncbi:hypothetical protein D9M71_815500 [compost metagenome]